MNIVFLDIDGVLNSDVYYTMKSNVNKEFPFSEIDPRNIFLLNKILERTGAGIVISSNRRLEYTKDVISDCFKKLGFIGEIIGYTPDLCSYNKFMVRGNEILKWMTDECPVNLTNYVIIDDESEILYEQKDNFVKVDNAIGLCNTDVLKSIKILINASK